MITYKGLIFLSYKGTRTRMAHKYKNVCMLEASGIRYIPRHKRMTIKGYKKSQEKITFHHLVKKEDGGEVSEENGALLKEYNHKWIHTLPPEKLEQVNNKLREYKLSVIQLGYEETQRQIVCEELDFKVPNLDSDGVDYYVIRAYDNKESQRPNERQYAKEFVEALNGR